MTTALLLVRDKQTRTELSSYIQDWLHAFKTHAPDLTIRVYPDIGDINEIEFLLVLTAPPGIFAQFPQVKSVFALSAGVDHIVADKSLLPQVPLVRLMDPFMADAMCQYAAAYVLHYVREITRWQSLQKQHRWGREPPFEFPVKKVGVMGLGYLGKKVGLTLHQLGFAVNGWSRLPKEIPELTVYAGTDQFNNFLQDTDILICLLPNTSHTQNILNKNTLAQLKKGAYLINMARGVHLVDEDLIAALKSGQLSGATLDVFRQEPLPVDHPFWDHPQIIITPHIASITNPATAVLPVVKNIRRIQKGEKPVGKVDFSRGY